MSAPEGIVLQNSAGLDCGAFAFWPGPRAPRYFRFL
jgi:hypothetical protein